MIDAHPRLRRLNPVVLDIVCFRYDPGGMDAAALTRLNAKIMMRLQENGLAAFLDTLVHGAHWLRAAMCNHRTTDLELALAALVRIGDALARQAGP